MKRARTTIIALASLVLLSACGLAPEEKLAKAEASFAAKDYAAAKIYLVSALKEKPGDAEMLLLLARTQIALGDGEGAFASLQRLPKTLRSASLVGEAEMLRGRYAAAIEAIGEPETADEARVAALAHLAIGDLDTAKGSLPRAKGSKATRQVFSPRSRGSRSAKAISMPLAQRRTAPSMRTEILSTRCSSPRGRTTLPMISHPRCRPMRKPSDCTRRASLPRLAMPRHLET